VNRVLIFGSGARYTEVLLKKRTEMWPEMELVRGIAGCVG
jgi:hypothetical protein